MDTNQLKVSENGKIPCFIDVGGLRVEFSFQEKFLNQKRYDVVKLYLQRASELMYDKLTT